jgi:hypothetical protein
VLQAGVVDEQVETAEGRLRLGERALHVGLARDVHRHRERLRAALLDLGNHSLRLVCRADVVDRHSRAVRRELVANALPDA